MLRVWGNLALLEVAQVLPQLWGSSGKPSNVARSHTGEAAIGLIVAGVNEWGTRFAPETLWLKRVVSLDPTENRVELPEPDRR